MKSLIPGSPTLFAPILAAVAASLLASCAETGTTVSPSGAVTTTAGLIPDLIRARNERKRGPLPESEWNKYGFWKKVRSGPPTYVPAAYPATAPRTADSGRWFVDRRDQKRLFVPYLLEGDMSPSVLAVEADKIIDWQYSKGEAWHQSVKHGE